MGRLDKIAAAYSAFAAFLITLASVHVRSRAHRTKILSRKQHKMSQIQELLLQSIYYLDGTLIFVMLVIRFSGASKLNWAILGLISISLGSQSAVILLRMGLNSPDIPANVISIVLGSLGVRFVGNWLADGAK